ncbi:hypothetical protein N0V90_002307 [Kalmusia sp. IMI 367209]|nr:hypothetical protein N0V90_002307 [Kalmusia sp. IMI 367209]
MTVPPKLPETLQKILAKHKCSSSDLKLTIDALDTYDVLKWANSLSEEETVSMFEILAKKHDLSTMSFRDQCALDDATYHLLKNPAHLSLSKDLQTLLKKEDLSAPTILSIAELQEQIKMYIAVLNQYCSHLKLLMCGFEEQIRNRWRKKSKGQRKDILRAACPHIPTSHRPDLQSVRSRAFLDDQAFLKDQAFWKEINHTTLFSIATPYINLEDLSERNPLLLFFFSRTRNHPYEFAHADLESAPLFKQNLDLLEPSRNRHTMVIMPGPLSRTYGQLIAWDKESDAVASIRSGLTVHPDHGLQILEIQLTIWEFLIACCYRILPDIFGTDDSTGRILEIPIVAQPAAPPITSDHDASVATITVARDVAYRMPSSLNLDRLKSLIAATRSQLQDQIWQLREDPGFFATYVREVYAHRGELVPDHLGNSHKSSTTSLLYNKVLQDVVTTVYITFWNFDDIHRRLHQWESLAIKFKDDIVHGKVLPEPVADHIMETRYFLEVMVTELVTIFRQAFAASPPIRQNYTRKEQSGETFLQEKVQHVKDPLVREAIGQVAFLWHKETRGILSIYAVMDELDRFLHSETASKELFTPFVTSLLSYISVIAECLNHINLYQPWASSLEHSYQERKFTYAYRQRKSFSVWDSVLTTTFERTTIGKLGNPSNGKFAYPTQERRSIETTTQLRAAEAALDALWRAVDTRYRKVAGKSPQDIVKGIIEERTLERTPPWEPPPQCATPNSGLATGRKASQEFPNDAFASCTHDVEKQITGSLNNLSVGKKKKLKTRGVAAPREVRRPPQANALRSIEKTRIVVDKRAFRVFKILFHSPDSPNQPGEVCWDDFLHAVVSAGFSAEKLQGSSWHFTPMELAADRPIQFHEPHPGNKLPFTWARQYGRRFNRAYGWDGATFTMKG